MSTSEPRPDYGIDLTVNDIEAFAGHHAETGYKLDVQAKSTTLSRVSNTEVRYDLEVAGYNALRHPAPGCPRILVVLVLPEHEAEWLAQTEEGLTVRRCAYWVSLKGQGPTANRRSVRVVLRRANAFTASALRGIMNAIKAGEEL